MNQSVSRLEKQARLYWRTMQEGIATSNLTDFQDELETLALMTESPTLRRLSLRNSRRFDHLGSTVKVAK